MHTKRRKTRKGGNGNISKPSKFTLKTLRARLKDPKFTINNKTYYNLIYENGVDPNLGKQLQNYAKKRNARIPTVKLSSFQDEFTDLILPPDILDISIPDKSYTDSNLIDKYSAQQLNVRGKLGSNPYSNGIFTKYGNAIITNYIVNSLSGDICALSTDDKLSIYHIRNNLKKEKYVFLDKYQYYAILDNLGDLYINDADADATASVDALKRVPNILYNLMKNEATRKRHTSLFNQCSAPLFSFIVSLKIIKSLGDSPLYSHRQMIIVNKETKEIYISDTGMGLYFIKYYTVIQDYINSIAQSDDYYITGDTMYCPGGIQSKTNDDLCTVWTHVLLHLWMLNSSRSFADIQKLLYTKSVSALRVLINAYTVFMGNIFAKREGILQEIGEFNKNMPVANILRTLKDRTRTSRRSR